MNRRARLISGPLGAALLALACAACEPQQSASPQPASSQSTPLPAFDPVIQDPPDDAAHPASMQGLLLKSHDSNLNGVIYEATGAGPHPTLLLLHGFPGNELNHDIAQAVRRAGWNALTFHYRGSWGSEGDFSLQHVLEDAGAVFDAIRATEFAALHRIDPARVSLFGHSMGGFAALKTGAARPEARCTVSVAGANFAALGAAGAADPKLLDTVAATFQAWGSGPIANHSGQRMVDELMANRAALDVMPALPALATRPALLVAANRDDITPPVLNHEPQLAALRTAGATRVEELRLDADHAFSGSRIALARAVTGFLQQNCQ